MRSHLRAGAKAGREYEGESRMADRYDNQEPSAYSNGGQAEAQHRPHAPLALRLQRPPAHLPRRRAGQPLRRRLSRVSPARPPTAPPVAEARRGGRPQPVHPCGKAIARFGTVRRERAQFPGLSGHDFPPLRAQFPGPGASFPAASFQTPVFLPTFAPCIQITRLVP